MTDSPDREEAQPVCLWCGDPLTDEEAVKEVCHNCERLLKGAGLSDEDLRQEGRDGLT